MQLKLKLRPKTLAARLGLRPPRESALGTVLCRKCWSVLDIEGRCKWRHRVVRAELGPSASSAEQERSDDDGSEDQKQNDQCQCQRS